MMAAECHPLPNPPFSLWGGGELGSFLNSPPPLAREACWATKLGGGSAPDRQRNHTYLSQCVGQACQIAKILDCP